MLLESSSRAAGFLVFCPLSPQTTKPLWSTRGISQLLRLSCKSTSQRLQTDRQTPRGAGLGLQPEQPGRNPFLGNHLVRAAAAPSRAVNPSSQQGWIWQETTIRVLSGAAATPAQPHPSEEQLPLAVSNLLVQPWDCCCRLPLQAPLCFGEELECLLQLLAHGIRPV